MAARLERAQMVADDRVARGQRPSILFVCTGNTCRSVMAEAFARRRFGEAVHVLSAGLKPQSAEDATTAIETLRLDFGIDASSQIPRDAKFVSLSDFERLVAMDKDVARELRKMTAREVTVWNVPDPWDG